MALSTIGKLGVSAALGAGSSLATDAALQYFTNPQTAAVAPATTATDNWYNKYSSYLGIGAALVISAILYKVWGAEEALVCAISGVAAGVAAPLHGYAAENHTVTGLAALRQLAAVRQLSRVA